jgi:septal ring factor EnvC (AmiA/AmiB activator)
MQRAPLLLAAFAVIGSLVSATLFFQIGNSKKLLEQRLADADTRSARLDASIAAANEQNGALKAQLQAAAGELSAAREKITATEQRVTAAEQRAAQSDRELAQTKSVLGLYEQTANALAQEIAGLRAEVDDVRNTHAAPEAVAAYKATIAELEKQLASARAGTAAPGTAAASTAVFTNRAGRATILTVGPESAFVVLNFGSARGAQLGHKLTVTQAGNEIALLQISDVRPNHSVAQVVPNSLRGVLQKGDSAVLLRAP